MVGDRINGERLRRKLSLRALAKQATLSTSALHRIIHGQQEARASEVSSLAKVLDVSTDYLLNGRRARRGAAA